MRVVVQRVSRAEVRVEGQIVGRIEQGLVLLVAIEDVDTSADSEWLANKVVQLRIFDDERGVMNRSLLEIGGGILLVSQFTLLASTRKGSRPGWSRAARPEVAEPRFQAFQFLLQDRLGRPIPTGIFGAEMEVQLVNEGPVTLMLDSRLRE